jgi:acyl-ACP thioesterase
VANLSDVDFNKHVNNKSYINLAEMTAPAEFMQNHTLKSLHVRFNRETFLGDTLQCTTYKTTEPKTYAHIIEKDGTSVCDIVTTWQEQKENTRIVDYDLPIKNER